MLKSIGFFVISLICLGLLDGAVDSIALSKNWLGILIFLVVLTLVNWLVLPLFKVIAFPFNLLSLGLVNFLINLGGLWIAIKLTDVVSINDTGLGYLLNLALISFTLSIAQVLSNKLID
jgi:uncharacterized membrane protein YvlD (DUF360 family)